MNKSSWGPVFGIDLIINDKANLQAKCYFKMNGCYKSVNDMKETNNLSERHLGGGGKKPFQGLIVVGVACTVQLGKEQREKLISISKIIDKPIYKQN